MVRERALSGRFISNLEAVLIANKLSHAEMGSLLRTARKLEDLWREHSAVGKREAGYGPIYAEILQDLPPVRNVLEIGVLGGGGSIVLGPHAGLTHQFMGWILTPTPLSVMGVLPHLSPINFELRS
jgi:hypothetical protein